jgi:hypothetical protein
MLEAGPPPPPESVPVFVDAIRDIEDVPMARVTYFVVASNVPEPSWLIHSRLEPTVSLQVLGLMGIICGPAPPSRLFEDPDQISQLFSVVEDSEGLSVEIEDLWLPASWFPPSGQPELGAVYRVDLPLFQRAYRYRTEEMSHQLSSGRGEWEGAISPSPQETSAFAAWATAQIDMARRDYPKDPDLELAYTEGSRPWMAQE